jgi:hypothetical protein
MPFKDLEHDGDEVFQVLEKTNREGVKKSQEERASITHENLLKAMQNAYMNINNPALWDGEI